MSQSGKHCVDMGYTNMYHVHGLIYEYYYAYEYTANYMYYGVVKYCLAKHSFRILFIFVVEEREERL